MSTDTNEDTNKKIAELDVRLSLIQASKMSIQEWLEKLPALKTTKELEVYQKAVELADTKKHIELIEFALREEILLEMDGDKRRFSNEDMRRIELKKRLDKNENYQVFSKREQTQYDAVERAKIELNFLRDMLVDYQHIAELIGRWQEK